MGLLEQQLKVIFFFLVGVKIKICEKLIQIRILILLSE